MRRARHVADERDLFRTDSSSESDFGEITFEPCTPPSYDEIVGPVVTGARGSVLETMMESDRFGDLIMRCVNADRTSTKEYRVSRAFLASCSELWRETLYEPLPKTVTEKKPTDDNKEDEKKSEVSDDECDKTAKYAGRSKFEDDGKVLVIDDNPAFMAHIIRYAYFLDPQITVLNALPIRFLAAKYEINGLKRLCEDKMSDSSVNADNFCEMLTASLKYEMTDLTNACMSALEKNFSGSDFKKLFQSFSFTELPIEAMTMVLKSDNLRVKEDDLWDHLWRWAHRQCEMVELREVREKSKSPTQQGSTVGNGDDGSKTDEKDTISTISRNSSLTADDETDEKELEKLGIKTVSLTTEKDIGLKEPIDFMLTIKYHIRFPLMSPTKLLVSVNNTKLLSMEEQFCVMKSRLLKKRLCPFVMKKRKGVASFEEATVFSRGHSSSSWSYSGSFDALCIRCDRQVALCGVGLWCADGGTEASLVVFRGDNGGSGTREREEPQQRFDIGRNAEPHPFIFSSPFIMDADQQYCIELHQRNIQSNSSFSTSRDTRTTITENGVTMRINSANSSPNSTSTSSGALPCFYICTDI